jgi:hypothetical protein
MVSVGSMEEKKNKNKEPCEKVGVMRMRDGKTKNKRKEKKVVLSIDGEGRPLRRPQGD